MKEQLTKLKFAIFVLSVFYTTNIFAQENSDKIVFYFEQNSDAEICVMNSDGTDLQQVTNNSTNDKTPAWSPSGNKIAFSSDRDGNSEIYVMNSDGSNQARLTNTPETEIQPEWSPDGSYIAFTRYYSSPTWDDGEIFVINADGSNEQQLTDNTADNTRPVWSPDGTKITYSTNKDGNYEIYTMNPDGSEKQRLTNSTNNEMFAQISPCGTKIIYATVDFQTFTGEVHIMDIDGTNDITLTGPGEGENPAWSPDGSKIIYQTNHTGNFEFFVMNPDGSEKTNNSTEFIPRRINCISKKNIPHPIKYHYQ